MPKYTDYMIAGYAVAILLYSGLVFSIWWRYRSLEKTEQLLEKLEND